MKEITILFSIKIGLKFDGLQKSCASLSDCLCFEEMNKVLACLVVFTCLFCAHFLPGQVHYVKGLKLDAKFETKFANLIEDKFHYLNVSKVGSALVSTFIDCSVACIKTVSCFSFNLAASPDIDGKLWCELLATDKYNASDKFEVNQFFHHYSIDVGSFSLSVCVCVCVCVCGSANLFCELFLQNDIFATRTFTFKTILFDLTPSIL